MSENEIAAMACLAVVHEYCDCIRVRWGLEYVITESSLRRNYRQHRMEPLCPWGPEKYGILRIV